MWRMFCQQQNNAISNNAIVIQPKNLFLHSYRIVMNKRKFLRHCKQQEASREAGGMPWPWGGWFQRVARRV